MRNNNNVSLHEQQRRKLHSSPTINNAAAFVGGGHKQTIKYPSLILKGHGITKINFDELHPLPEKPEDDCFISDTNSERYLQLSPEQESLSSSTGGSSAATVRSINGFFSENISSSIGTGATERSSICSWGIEDEFDEQAANHVRWMFDEVDSCLFEDVQIPSSEIRNECSDWKHVYPYLRILGTQLVSTNESGTEMIAATPGNLSTPVMGSTDESRIDNEIFQLNINGHKVEALTAPSAATSEDESEKTLSFLEEEVFAIDGDLEEYIAYDNNYNIDCYENGEKKLKKKHSSLPPMTPSAFVHETALSECFDHLWNEIIPILKRLLLLYTQARARREIERVQESFDQQMDRFLESSLELPQSRDSYGRLHPLPTPLKMKVGSMNGAKNLQELITIRSLELQQRAPSVTPHGLVNDDIMMKDTTNGRPLSSVHRQFPKATNFRNAEQQFYERMLSAKTPKKNIRLQPIAQKSSSQIPENTNVGEVRGTRLQTAGSISSVSSLWGARHTLPPLDRLGTADTTVSENRIRTSKRNGRASSAVSNESKSSPNRERMQFQALPDSRPYTTHASSRTDFMFHGKSLTSSKPRDFPTSSSKSFIPSNVFTDSLYPFPTHMKNMTISSVGEENEVDDFVLFGHGPPILPPQQRKGKVPGTSVR